MDAKHTCAYLPTICDKVTPELLKPPRTTAGQDYTQEKNKKARTHPLQASLTGKVPSTWGAAAAAPRTAYGWGRLAYPPWLRHFHEQMSDASKLPTRANTARNTKKIKRKEQWPFPALTLCWAPMAVGARRHTSCELGHDSAPRGAARILSGRCRGGGAAGALGALRGAEGEVRLWEWDCFGGVTARLPSVVDVITLFQKRKTKHTHTIGATLTEAPEWWRIPPLFSVLLSLFF